MSIDDQRYAVLTLQSLRVTIGPLQASTTSLESQESYLTAGMLPYNRNVTLQTFLSSTRDFYRLHSTFARLYNAAASPASRLRSAGSLAISNYVEYILSCILILMQTSVQEISASCDEFRNRSSIKFIQIIEFLPTLKVHVYPRAL